MNRRPDIVVVDYAEKDNKTSVLTDITVPGNTEVEKEQEKVGKYQNMTRELKRLWKVDTNIIPVVICASNNTIKPGENPAESWQQCR